MITKMSIIGTLKNGETKTASVSVKGRKFNNKDYDKLLERGIATIECNMDMFEKVNICLEMRKDQWSKPYKEYEEKKSWSSYMDLMEDICMMMITMQYEVCVGRFENCKF